MNNHKKHIITALLFSIAVLMSVLSSYTVCKGYFKVAEPNTSIRIENTATKNIISYGSDVRIRSITIDERKISFEELEFNEDEWIYLDDLLVSVNPSNPVSISCFAENAKMIKIELQKHHGSGIIAVWANDRLVGKMDLYSSDWQEVIFQQSLGKVKITSNLTAFFIILAVSFSITNSWYYIYREKKEFSKCIFACIGFFILLTALHILFWGIDGSGGFISAEIIVLTVILDIYLCKRKKVEDHIHAICNMITLVFSAWIQFYIVELINGNIGTIVIKYILGNMGIYFVVFWLIYVFIRKLYISVGIGMVLMSGFGIANYYVVKFRGSPIVPGDFFVLETAKSVAGNYQYTLTNAMVFAAVLFSGWILILFLLERHLKKISKKDALVGTGGVVLLTVGILTFDFYKPNLDLWNLNNNVKTYGVTMSLISNIRRMNMEEPDGYSRNNLEMLCEDYAGKSEQEEELPNIIAIMNESFSDLSVLDEKLDNNIYMPYFNSIENAVKGTVMVSTIGGGTGNTEYEFLTGNTMGFMPGTVPYQQYILGESYSLTSVLKQLGYYAAAIHPYDKKGYNRYRVYPYLGFDEFIDIEGFENPELIRNLYISDKDSYKKVIQTYEKIKESDQPAFIFNVTMQNHSGYESGYFDENVISVPGREGIYKDVEEYLTLIKESDDALSVLIDYFSSVDEPTVIVFFGDHQPKISDVYYEDTMGKTLSEFSLTENQQRYVAPFFIWANYDIPKTDGVLTSMNYLAAMTSEIAGLPTSPYQNFLLSIMKDIPAININGYQTVDGMWHSYSEITGVEKILNDYKNIQYNNVFDKNKCEKWFAVN